MTARPPQAASTRSAHHAAARNNAEWCDIFCRTYGLVGEFHTDMWTSARRTPPFYPDAVTLVEGVSPDRLLARLDTISADCSVKDSFADLDLASSGFRVLFDAEWIYRPADTPLVLPRPRAPWQQVRDAAFLARWETAWSGSDEAPGLFRSELLCNDDVVILAGLEGDRIVAGTILNRSETVVGVSNLFTTEGDTDRAWVGCLAAVVERFPGMAVVGYEAGEELRAAHNAGFTSVGSLRIWVAEAG